MRIVHLSSTETVLLDVWAWGVIHLAVGYVVHRFPVRWLSRDNSLFRDRGFERDGSLYLKKLHIMAWKDRLPEAGAMFAGGISKQRLTGDEQGGLRRFAVETRRAELTHWSAMAAGPFFVLWNPGHVVPVMIAFGVAFNLPFVMIQRFNRIRINRILRRRTARNPVEG